MPRTAFVSICLLSMALASSLAIASPSHNAASPPLTATFETTLRAPGRIQRERWTLSREPSYLEYLFDRGDGRAIDREDGRAIDREDGRAIDREDGRAIDRGESHVKHRAHSHATSPGRGRMIDAWSRTPTELTLTRIFPDQRTVVEYTEGQLRALGSLRSWRQLGSLLPEAPQSLGLRKTGDVKVGDRTAEHYEGQWDGARVVVDWLKTAQLPASLEITRDKVTRTTTLLFLKLNHAQRSQMGRYRRIDAADLGDLEHGPF